MLPERPMFPRIARVVRIELCTNWRSRGFHKPARAFTHRDSHSAQGDGCKLNVTKSTKVWDSLLSALSPFKALNGARSIVNFGSAPASTLDGIGLLKKPKAQCELSDFVKRS
jgi:hypothetical protein